MSNEAIPLKKSKRIVRAVKALKHYRNNILTQAGEPTLETLTELLTDLRHAAEKHGLCFETCAKVSLQNSLAEST